MTKEEIKKMMIATKDELIFENDYTLEYVTPEHTGIVFEFDEKGLLFKVY